MPQIGLALSGGGHRASLFARGVLLYLTDVQRNRDVVSIASVSGGSVTNGYFAQVRGYHKLDIEEGLRHSQKFARQLALQGTLWASFLTWAYLLTTILVLVLVIAVSAMPWSGLSRLLVFFVGLAVWHKLLAEKRGVICDWAYATTLFNKEGTATKLEDIETEINHVFCATDLHAGEHVYFASDFVYAYRFGLGKPGNLPLSTAVQVSAAFPGGFPPRALKTGRHDFQGGQQKHAKVMVLTDGGVYDNMGEQWAVGLKRRKERVPVPQFKEVDELIVVNSSATMGWHSLKLLRIPLLGELFGLLEVVNTLYDNTTSPRRARGAFRCSRQVEGWNDGRARHN
jgi:predicted acylesterase/phospholipase RssA